MSLLRRMRAENVFIVIILELVLIAVILFIVFGIDMFLWLWPFLRGSIFVVPLIAIVLIFFALIIGGIWWFYTTIIKHEEWLY